MNADYSPQRAKMVDGQLRTTDVSNVPLLDAMGEVPREAFVPARKRELAYIDEDLEISGASGGPARFLMEPSPFAKLVQLADVQSSDVVLDIGCGTGYSAAILSRIASFVVALECDSVLAEAATETLDELGCVNVSVVEGALQEGYPGDAPYDVIFVGGAVDEVPDALLAQLRDGGRLVAVIGQGNAARAHIFVKNEEVVSSRPAFNVAVKALPGFQKKPEFDF